MGTECINHILYPSSWNLRIPFPIQSTISGNGSQQPTSLILERPLTCLQFPFNNDCANNQLATANLNMGSLRLEVARPSHDHVRKTLPPSISGFPGEAEIRYYVKATVVRPQFYKENYRSVCEPCPTALRYRGSFCMTQNVCVRTNWVLCLRLPISNFFRSNPRGEKSETKRLTPDASISL